MKKDSAAHAAPGQKPRSKAKLVGGLLALLVIGSCAANMGKDDDKKVAAPATTAAVSTAPATSSAPAATTAAPSSAPAATQAPQVKADTAASVVERMDCSDKVLDQAKLDADALTPRWAGTAKSVAACTKNDFTQVVVAEYASHDEALRAVARAQEITGWHNRVTVDGRFARGASGNDWASVDFPKINQ